MMSIMFSIESEIESLSGSGVFIGVNEIYCDPIISAKKVIIPIASFKKILTGLVVKRISYPQKTRAGRESNEIW
jgi:hypothetical protein